MLRPGVLLGNRYRLDERIAGGGMGDVWRGTDEVLGRTVAVKILLPALLDEPGFAERFRGEARTMATINHPGVVDVYDYGSDEQVAFLVMEYIEGDALSRTLSRVKRLTPARTMALTAQAADALQAAHEKGIVHRDVKPGNLLVRPNGTLVLTDFGIARSAIVGQLTAVGSVLGTASYFSPEQASGATVTSASDVYSLGVVAYQCLSGHRPFEGPNPMEIAMKHVQEAPRPLPGDIPPPVRAIVDRAMAKDPAARWPSAAALAAVARQAAAALATPGHGAASGRASASTGPSSGPPAAARPTSGSRGAPGPGAASAPVPTAQGTGQPAGPRPPQPARPPAGPIAGGAVPGHPGNPAGQPVRPAPAPQPPRPGTARPAHPGATAHPGPSGPQQKHPSVANPQHPGMVAPQAPAGPVQGYQGSAAATQPPRPAARPYGGFAPAGAGYSPPHQPAPSAEERNRNSLIAVVLVVGLLALLSCAGVIGYLAQLGA